MDQENLRKIFNFIKNDGSFEELEPLLKDIFYKENNEIISQLHIYKNKIENFKRIKNIEIVLKNLIYEYEGSGVDPSRYMDVVIKLARNYFKEDGA